MKKETALEKLQNAFLRLKEGKPLRIKADRKVTQSSVEDEAGVSKSTLRNTDAYSTLFDEIVAYKKSIKNNTKTSKTPKNKPSSINKEVAELKNIIKELREKVNNKQQTIDFLVAANTELTALLSEKVTNKQLNEFLRSQEAVVNIMRLDEPCSKI